MAKTLLCKTDEVPAGGLKAFDAGPDRKVCVIRAGGEYFACQAYCPHQGTALCEGSLDGTVLTCLEHLWQWDLRNGVPLGLAETPLALYGVEVEGDEVFLKE